MKANFKIAMAAGNDAANRSMRAAGRTLWNEDDYNVAVSTYDRLLGVSATATVEERAQIWMAAQR